MPDFDIRIRVTREYWTGPITERSLEAARELAETQAEAECGPDENVEATDWRRLP